MIYAQQRWLDYETGQFISEDPIMDGLNWYTYAGGNPMGAVDPAGLDLFIFFELPSGGDTGHVNIGIGQLQNNGSFNGFKTYNFRPTPIGQQHITGPRYAFNNTVGGALGGHSLESVNASVGYNDGILRIKTTEIQDRQMIRAVDSWFDSNSASFLYSSMGGPKPVDERYNTNPDYDLDSDIDVSWYWYNSETNACLHTAVSALQGLGKNVDTTERFYGNFLGKAYLRFHNDNRNSFDMTTVPSLWRSLKKSGFISVVKDNHKLDSYKVLRALRSAVKEYRYNNRKNNSGILNTGRGMNPEGGQRDHQVQEQATRSQNPAYNFSNNNYGSYNGGTFFGASSSGNYGSTWYARSDGSWYDTSTGDVRTQSE